MYGYYGFISYKRGDRTDPWHAEVKGHVEAILRSELGRGGFDPPAGGDVELFQDLTEIRGGSDWTDRIRLGLAHSPVLIAFCSTAYFESAWCMAELSAFLRREKSLGLPQGSLVKTIAVRKPASFPAWATQAMHFDDFSDHFVPLESFWRTEKAALFVAEVLLNFSEEVADLIRNRPEFDHGFPPVTPPDPAGRGGPAPVAAELPGAPPGVVAGEAPARQTPLTPFPHLRR